MKGGVLGYGAILAILIVGSAAIIFTTQANPQEEIISTKEGTLTSSGNFIYFLLKTFDQSIEFISQRAAYDLGENGGFIEGRDFFWNYHYPKLSDLRKNLEDRIEDTLPSFYKKFEKIINLDNINLRIGEGLPLENSRFFDVKGFANISVYDELARSRTHLNREVDSRVISSYFKLLYVGREILTNETFNSSLNDINGLKLKLRQEFKDLDFDITAVDDVVYITIEDICYPSDTYCLAPLYSDEPKILRDSLTGDPIPYDRLKLKFKTIAEQTGGTPSVCDFSFELDPNTGSVGAGDEVDPPALIKINNLGTTDDIVGLSAIVYKNGAIDTTIDVEFVENNKEMPYNTLMRIKTKSTTLKGDYVIEVKAKGCTPKKEIIKNYDLRVDPSMTFHIDVDPDPVKLIKEAGYSNITDVFVVYDGGDFKDVYLYFDPGDLPIGIDQELSKNNIPPDFVSVLNLTINGDPPIGTWVTTIRGIGGGSYEEKEFDIIVEPPFDFSLDVNPNKREVHKSQDGSTTVTVHKTIPQATSEEVTLSYSVESKTKGPGDYDITVSFGNSPCTPDPNCLSGMSFWTEPSTPPDEYVIYITGSTPKISHQISFDLIVKPPECTDMGTTPSDDCFASKGPVTICANPVGGICPCKYWECVNFECQEESYVQYHMPDIDGDGISDCGTEDCDEGCETDPLDGIDKKYKDPTGPCNVRCDGGANLGECKDSCDLGDCKYDKIIKCAYGCKDNVNCVPGIFCNSEEACCRNGPEVLVGICCGSESTGAGGDRAIWSPPIPVAFCFEEGNVPHVLANVTCGGSLFGDREAVVVANDCNYCPEGAPHKVEVNCKDDNSGCEGTPYEGGCSKVDCSQTDFCTYACYDSDGGDDIFTKGICTDGDGVIHEDVCTDNTHIKEYECSFFDGYHCEVVTGGSQSCPGNCDVGNGRCL